MSSGLLTDRPHRRKNILTGEYVLVSPHRAKRPWQGAEEDASPDARPKYDPECYLCPGNARIGGEKNPPYTGVYAFDNDFPALVVASAEADAASTDEVDDEHNELFIAEAETGIGRVICFSPRHDLTLAGMSQGEIHDVARLWQAEYRQLGDNPDINHVQIFENKGQAMGCSNPHPHGQIWAQRSIPNEPAKELAQMRAYRQRHGRNLLGDYLLEELKREERIVCRNDKFVALVPFWAVWPFECMILPVNDHSSLLDMTDDDLGDLAEIVGKLTAAYDSLFNVSFPYSAGIHQAPTDGKDHSYCTFHMHFYPPLLRSATVKKFMVGYEMLGEAQRDITAESSASILRELVRG